MKAIVITRPGGPDVLELQERPIPETGDFDVLIKVYAAGVNRPDVAQRKGSYPPPPWAPQDIPGLEVAGIVEGVGNKVWQWQPGDSVCALVVGGGYSEFCKVPAAHCLPVPDSLSFVEAASLPETFFTVWSNVFERGGLAPGESLLVHGGSSGIGVAAIQLASAMGSRVYATAGSEEKCSFCEGLGADRAINYKTESFKDVIHLSTLGKGIDVILDMVGGPYLSDNLEILTEEGRLVLINFMKGEEAVVKLGVILRKRLSITGSMLRSRDDDFKAALAAAVEKNVWPLIASKRIKPVIHKVFPFQAAAEAHRIMEASEHMGKLILTVREG